MGITLLAKSSAYFQSNYQEGIIITLLPKLLQCYHLVSQIGGGGGGVDLENELNPTIRVLGRTAVLHLSVKNRQFKSS